MHTYNTPGADGLAGACIGVLLAANDGALIDSRIAELTKGFVGNLKCHGHQRCSGVHRQRHFGSVIVMVTGKTGAVQRAGQIVAYRVHQRLDSLVLERRTHHDRHDITIDRRLADGLLDELFIGGLLFEHQFHQIIMMHAEFIEHCRTCILSGILQIIGNVIAGDFPPVAAPRISDNACSPDRSRLQIAHPVPRVPGSVRP